MTLLLFAIPCCTRIECALKDSGFGKKLPTKSVDNIVKKCFQKRIILYFLYNFFVLPIR